MEPVPQTSDCSATTKRFLTFAWTKHGTVAVILVLLVAGVVFLPVVPTHGERFPPRARTEIAALHAAINEYHRVYGRYPVPRSEKNGDQARRGQTSPISSEFLEQNADTLAILLAVETFQDGTPVANNSNNLWNPRKIRFIELKMARDNKSNGVGLDGSFRDPWGNPYVITLDADFDGYCLDPLYSQSTVTKIRPEVHRPIQLNPRTNKVGLVELPHAIMIWSLGPDGKADPTLPANQGANRDNILSWQ